MNQKRSYAVVLQGAATSASACGGHMKAMPTRRSQPWPDVPDARRRVMKANKGKHTMPEVAVRKMLHALGYRFRLHRRGLPGTPDVVFGSRKAAIQIHGCFWHQHEDCRHARTPVTRQHYWGPKLARNVERDRQAEASLASLGWRLEVVWECELADAGKVAGRLRAFLGPTRFG